MKLAQKILFVFICFATLTFSSGVFAQEAFEYTPLEPIPQLTVGGDACDPVNAPTSTACRANLSEFVPKAFQLIIQIAGALAVIMIVIGGFQYASTDALNDKKEGREKIKNALYGLLLAIGAFIILNTLNPRTLSLDLSLNPIRTEPAPTGTLPTLTPCSEDPTGTHCTVFGDPEEPGTQEVWPNDDPWRTRLRQLGIGINKINCSRIGGSNCTSVYELGGANGMANRVINGLIKLNEDCKKVAGCSIEITGGTEYWLHGNKTLRLTPGGTNSTAHRPRGSAVDITLRNSALNDIIRSYPEITGSNGCATGYAAYQVHGATYVDEVSSDRHWHVCY